MSKATDPLDSTGGNTAHTPKPTTPAPAGYFTTPEPAPDYGPEPATAASSNPEAGTTAEAGHLSNSTTANKATATTAPAVRHPVRVGTVVWGAVVLVLGILIILSSQLELHLNAGMTAMWLLFGAGVAMLAGGAINLFRKMRP